MDKMSQLMSIDEKMRAFEGIGECSVRLRDCVGGPFQFLFSAEHESIFVAGRYLKFSRTLPQTPWIINGEVYDHIL